MPTVLPNTLRPARRLSWPEIARFFVLLGRVRWLDVRLHMAHRRIIRISTDAAGDQFLSLARRWLATHEEIAALLDMPPPPHVAQVRVILCGPTAPTDRSP